MVCLTRGQLVHDEKRENGIWLSGRINAFMMLVEDPLQMHHMLTFQSQTAPRPIS